MDEVDTIIVGAGVVGLAVADALSEAGKEIIVLEKHDGFGRETSSRNSEVIHAGLYYPTGSLKARLCVTGRRMLYEFCERNGVPFKKVGKLVVANHPEEREKIHAVHEQAAQNGVEGLRMLSRKQVAQLEPGIVAEEALFSPETGIVDTHQLMACLERRAGSRSATLAYGCEMTGIERNNDTYQVEIVDTDGERMRLECRTFVNAAGLNADAVAGLAGIDPTEAGYRQHYCKGEYFAVSSRHKDSITRLVYPAPTPVSLGIHVVLGLDGAMRLGPNAFYVDEIDYDVNQAHAKEFLAGAREYFPRLALEDLRPDQSGIRPKLQKEGEGFRDFVVAEESARGLPGLVNLAGIESPGLTSCLAIARAVAACI
ncbi:MAG: FAD-dependent oxidoreductase [Chitinivibrionales bacterium]|nr:FAD-dependent oxidoreductase [Chitinivibrionales bacterium]MBD3396211.1 FAD-dependent oxidoreductase [Chitinivibrionales bacterium]